MSIFEEEATRARHLDTLPIDEYREEIWNDVDRLVESISPERLRSSTSPRSHRSPHRAAAAGSPATSAPVSPPSLHRSGTAAAGAAKGTIYGHQFSQPSRSVQWYNAYSGKGLAVKFVDIMTRENAQPPFLAKFPGGQVPAYEEGAGFRLEESAAILQYLAEGDPIVPADKKTASRVVEMLARHLSQARKLTLDVVLPLFVLETEDEKAAAVVKGIETVEPILKTYNELLSKQAYVAGDRLTLADFLFAPEVDQFLLLTPLLKVDVLAGFPAIRAYISRLKSVAGYQDSFATAGEFLQKMASAK